MLIHDPACSSAYDAGRARLEPALGHPLCPTRHHQVYVYRLTSDGLPAGSYIWRGPATLELPEILRNEFRGGDFRVLIRKKRQMVFGGNISVETPRKESRWAAAPAVC